MKLHPVSMVVVVTALALSGCGLFGDDTEPSPSSSVELAEMARAGRAQIDRGEIEAGMATLREVLREDRNSIDALNGLALSHAIRGELDFARVYFDRAQELDPVGTMHLIELERLAELNRMPEPEKPRYQLASLGLYGPRLKNVVDPRSMIAMASAGTPVGASAGATSAAPAAFPIPKARPQLDGPLGEIDIILANGNGVGGVAARWRGHVIARGHRVREIRNARSYAHKVTSIVYPAGYEGQARSLRNDLGIDARLVEHDMDEPMLLVVLGRDSL